VESSTTARPPPAVQGDFMKPSEILREVVSMARAANTAREQEPAEGDAPLVSSGFDTTTMRPAVAEERRLWNFLQAQPANLVYLLTALMYLGRGDYRSKDDFLNTYADMSSTFGSPRAAARQMVVKTVLPDYLEQGLQRLQEMGLDIDQLAV
jgi:hypothetical protein